MLNQTTSRTRPRYAKPKGVQRAKSGATKSVRNPALTRSKILRFATVEFSEKGFDGARVDRIADRCQVSKNMLYYYYSSKEDLFLAVLEDAYSKLRDRHAEWATNSQDPIESLRDLIQHTFAALFDQQQFIRLLNEENLYKAKHIRRSKVIRKLYNPLFDKLQRILKQGVEKGIFRADADPKIVYMSLSSLAYHYVSNQHTLEFALQIPLSSKEFRKRWLEHITEMIVLYLSHR
jgi:TetR/AcrR family transcriptional regulator